MVWFWLSCALQPEVPPAAPPQAPLLDPAQLRRPEPKAADADEAWRTRPLRFTHHGRCRMRCRKFDQVEVRQLLEEGRWVPERTRLDGRCPSHAVEGVTRDGQNARMVFAACETETRLVTAIDLDTEHACNCD
ncbi:MAG: DUF4258 domain-containing protein [Myxococcota bacterium]